MGSDGNGWTLNSIGYNRGFTDVLKKLMDYKVRYRTITGPRIRTTGQNIFVVQKIGRNPSVKADSSSNLNTNYQLFILDESFWSSNTKIILKIMIV